MSRFRKILVRIFLFFVVLNFILFIVYKNRLKSARVHLPTEKEEVQPKTEIFTPTSTIKVLPEDTNKGFLKEIEVGGIIQENPVFDKKTKQATITISFWRTDNKQVRATVILGDEKDKILTFFAKDLASYQNGLQQWRERPVSELIPRLKKGDPIKVRFYLQKVSESWFNNPRCNALCKQRLERINSFFEANSQFFESLTGNELAQETFKIGAISALVISPSK